MKNEHGQYECESCGHPQWRPDGHAEWCPHDGTALPPADNTVAPLGDRVRMFRGAGMTWANIGAALNITTGDARRHADDNHREA